MPTPEQVEIVTGLQQTSLMALQTSYLAWGAIFTVVFAYLAALYYFIRERALLVRLISYFAFVFVLVFLVWSTNIFFQQVLALMDLIITIHETGLVPQVDTMGAYTSEGLDASFAVAVWAYNLFFLALLIGLGYLSVFYKWPGRAR